MLPYVILKNQERRSNNDNNNFKAAIQGENRSGLDEGLQVFYSYAGAPLDQDRAQRRSGRCKKIIETAINELTAITGQKAVATLSRKDISNFKVRKKMPIGVRVTLRNDRMYEFMERFIRVALPRIRDFKGIEGKLDGRGNYTVGITEQIIFPEINIDAINKLVGMNITFVTTAKTDEEGYALLKYFGLPFKNAK